MTAAVLDLELRALANTFRFRLHELREQFVGRDEAVDLLGLAVLCREHMLLIGPPGTAKTSLLDRFRRMLDADYFTYLLTRFTEPAELFGPVDIRRLQADGVYRVNTKGMLPDVEIAFLDEVFQANSAILNSLLTLINERRFHNGSRVQDAPLVTLLGSSNEIPDDPLLAAFSDRFLLRCQLDYVPDDVIEQVLDVGWRQDRAAIRAATADAGSGDAAGGAGDVPFGAAELRRLQYAVSTVDLGGIRDVYARILRAFRAEGIVFSDRRAVRAQRTFAAAALLAGRARAELDDLATLAHLWANPRDEPSIRRIMIDHAVTVREPGRTVRHQAVVRADIQEQLRLLAREGDTVGSPEEHRELLRRLRRLTVELRRDHPDLREQLGEVQRAQQGAIRLYRERYDLDGLGDG
ncbi:AAA family ATPase [Frankia sp. QA3]|uniref:AAA family ATPase n=1 Tax=Frankia sp. QA3 TaxID=710111 RepID=UPI000269C51E|nr:AAA family ATPase [Frankia sp. QA3]EIV94378.1 MoxR-like ATPase [Frankia sp. QA3]